MCEFLLDSFDLGESFTLLSIKREAAGSEDKKHIGDSHYVNTNQTTYLRDGKLVASHVFEISFTGKTRNCRTFINQLRAPIQPSVLTGYERGKKRIPKTNRTLLTTREVGESGILPIVRDISSKFTLEIEYVYKSQSSLHNRVSKILPVGSDTEKVEEILKQFN